MALGWILHVGQSLMGDKALNYQSGPKQFRLQHSVAIHQALDVPCGNRAALWHFSIICVSCHLLSKVCHL